MLGFTVRREGALTVGVSRTPATDAIRRGDKAREFLREGEAEPAPIEASPEPRSSRVCGGGRAGGVRTLGADAMIALGSRRKEH